MCININSNSKGKGESEMKQVKIIVAAMLSLIAGQQRLSPAIAN